MPDENTIHQGERVAIKDGKGVEEIRSDNPNKAAQNDIHARWTLKIPLRFATGLTAYGCRLNA